ncbi:DUF1080 domain-containing protein, partial [bacterium]|nr:DUF1080 domain-containing protein [bacterium]
MRRAALDTILLLLLPLLGAELASAGTPVKGFQPYGGSWQVRNGELWAGGGAGPKLISELPAFSVGEVGVEVFLPGKGGGNGALIVKVSDPGVGADAFNGYEIALDASGQFLRLGRHRQNYQNIKDVPYPVPVDQWVALHVKLTATTLEVLVAGKTVLTHDDGKGALVSGSIGLRPWQRAARYRNLWVKTGGKTRKIAFEPGPPPAPRVRLKLDDVPPFAFVTRHPLTSPPAVGQDLWAAQPRGPGCSIRVYDPARPKLPAKVIFSDPEGCIYDMNVSYDAKTLFFSRRRKGEKHWHIWRVKSDGSGLRQLTDGPHYDVSPCLLPDGDIVFVS